MAGTTQISSQQLSIAITQNQMLPDEGPKTIPLILDFTMVDTYTLDLQPTESRAIMALIQSIFIDMKDAGGAPLILTIEGTGQVIVAKPFTQGYYTVLVPNPSRLSFNCPGGPILKVFLLNMPVAGSVWATQ